VKGNRINISARTLDELRLEKHRILLQIDQGMTPDVTRGNEPLDKYFDYWYEKFAKNQMKATTCTNYKAYYEANIRGDLGRKALKSVSVADCQNVINRMVKAGKKKSTMTNLKSCMNNVFKCAMDEEIISKNPFQNIRVPKTKSDKREALERSQIELFLGYINNHPVFSRYYPEFVVLFNCGLRIGEMAALTWSDLDFKGNTIRINKTVNRYREKDFGYTRAVASPKSDTSERTIFFNSTVRKTLLKLKMQQGMKSDLKLPYVDDSGYIRGSVTGFVFTNSSGGVWVEPSFRKLINRIVEHQNEDAKKAGTELLESFTPHVARHSYTSLAYEAGADMKAVSEYLGHSSIDTTLNVYTSLTAKKKQEQEVVVQAIMVS